MSQIRLHLALPLLPLLTTSTGCGTAVGVGAGAVVGHVTSGGQRHAESEVSRIPAGSRVRVLDMQGDVVARGTLPSVEVGDKTRASIMSESGVQPVTLGRYDVVETDPPFNWTPVQIGGVVGFTVDAALALFIASRLDDLKGKKSFALPPP